MARASLRRDSARPVSPPDDTLVQAYAAGDLGAFEALYARYESRIYGFCLRLLGDPDTAADAFQEIFIRLVDGAGDYEPRGRFPSWFFTIARRVCLDLIRASRRKAFSDDGEVASPAASGAIAAIEHRDEVERYLSRLPPEQREVLLLHRYHGFAYEEIATMTGSTEAAVKQKAYRALKTLRGATP